MAKKLNAPIHVGNITVTTMQMSNIAWEVNRELVLDSATGHVKDDSAAAKLWGREYESGWAPHA